MTGTAKDVIRRRADTYLGWLSEACAIASLAIEPPGLVDMAAWLEAKFTELGASVRRLELANAPDALLAELGEGDRTVLIYDHYDVQPVDPLELWHTAPFEPTIRDGKLYARGCADNKGDLVARLAALEVYREVHGEFPFKIRFLVEGEEETGSHSFQELVSTYGEHLAADGCIWEGHGIDAKGRPEIVFGAKGLAYVELNIAGLNDDQHSSLAVVAPSPVWRMVEALSTLRGPDGTVLIDGFYENVVPATDEDLEMLRVLPFEENEERKRLGVDSFVADATGEELKRRYFFEPTCNIAGLNAGFTVPGTSKTVLPAKAMAKLDMRLVPNQTPDEVVDKLRKHLDARGFTDIEITRFSNEKPVRSSADTPLARAAIDAAHEVFEEAPAIAPLMIGTGPMYLIADELGIPTVSPAGVHRPDSNIHAPNENVRLDDYSRIIDYSVAWLKAFGDASR